MDSLFAELIRIIVRLRCQTRWSQTPHIPKNLVLGHSMYVAVLALLLSHEIKACDKMLVNNFHAALFHDLPESVTRDNISPLKQATRSLPSNIKTIEHKICLNELYPKVPNRILPELRYLLGDIDGKKEVSEFSDRIQIRGKVEVLEVGVLLKEYNCSDFNPINGETIKICDVIAAFMEAYKSNEYGVSTYHLYDGLTYIKI